MKKKIYVRMCLRGIQMALGTRLTQYRQWGLLAISGLYLLALPSGYGQSKTYNISTLITRFRLDLETAKTPAERAQIYFHLADHYSVINEDSTAYFANQGILLAEKLPDKHLLINLYGELGRSYESSGKISEGLRFLKKAEHLSQQYVKDSTTALTQLMLANFYTKQGDNGQALPKALAALRYLEQYCPDKKLILCKVYTSLGVISMNLKNYQQAIQYFNKLIENGAIMLGGFYVYLASVNIAGIYIELAEYEKTEAFARRALAKATELNSKRGIGFGLGHLSEIMYKTRRYPEAIEYGKEALQIRQQLADKRLIGLSLISLAEIYQAINQYPQAVTYANQGVALLRTTSDRVNTQKGLEIQALALEKTNDFQAALVAYKEAKTLNDSLTNVENAREVSRIQGTFDLERKQNQIALLNKSLSIEKLQAVQRQKQLLFLDQAQQAGELQNQLLTRKQQLNQSQLTLQAVRAKRQQTLITQQQNQLAFAQQQQLLYLAILFLLIGIISLISYFFRRQQTAKQLLSRQKEEIQEQAQRLTDLNETKDKLFSLISHDLRSPVASMKLKVRQIREVDKHPQQFLPLVVHLEKQVDSVLTLLTNLLDWSLFQLKGFQVQLQPISLYEVTEEILSQASDLIERKELGIIHQVDEVLLVMADKHQLRAVVRNVMSNAIKFTPLGGYIRIYAVVQGSYAELHIKDSGLGMSTSQLNALFSAPEVRPGTMGENGTGLGLRICREMLDRQGGTFQIESQPNRGTLVRIRLALAAEYF